MLALAPLHHRSRHHQAGALREGQDLVGDLLDGLLADLPAAAGAVGVPDPGIHQPEVVVDLGDRADRGAGVLAGPLLIDGDGRGEAVDMVDIRLLHLAEELARVGGERLHIAPLSLGVDGVEGKRRLAAPRETRQNDQAVPRQAEIDVLEVVLSRPSDVDGVVWHLLPSVPRTGRPATDPAASGLRRPETNMCTLLARGAPRPGSGSSPVGHAPHADENRLADTPPPRA